MEVVVPDEYRYLYRETPDWPVVKIPAPILRQVASPVTKFAKKTQEVVDEMIRVMKKVNGIGLAAPQVGDPHRMIVVAPPGIKPVVMINPKLLKAEGEQIGQEGCLSIPGLYGDVTRALYVEVEALDRKGKEVVFELDEVAARVALHEMDHLDGVLFIDKVDPSTLHWEHPQGASVDPE